MPQLAASAGAIALPFMLAAAAAAQAPADLSSGEQQTIRQIIVYGSDPCPPSTGNEVIVCARRPEGERYRIPENLREPAPSPESESWAERAQSIEMVGRTGIQSCSPVGPGGATGCLQQMIQQARRESEAARREQSNIP